MLYIFSCFVLQNLTTLLTLIWRIQNQRWFGNDKCNSYMNNNNFLHQISYSILFMIFEFQTARVFCNQADSMTHSHKSNKSHRHAVNTQCKCLLREDSRQLALRIVFNISYSYRIMSILVALVCFIIWLRHVHLFLEDIQYVQSKKLSIQIVD